MRKKLLSIALAIVVVLAALPWLSTDASALSNSQITAELDNIKANEWPTNSYYTGSFGGGWQCYAFARLLANEIFGSYPWNCSAYSDGYVDANGWRLVTGNSLNSIAIEPGDIIEVRPSTGSDHTAIVWKLSGDTIYVGECWGSYDGKIYWGNFNYYYATLSAIANQYGGYSKVYVWKHPSVGYLSSCESYPSYATLEVTKQTPMHSLPCSDLTDSSSERICTWSVGKKLTATGLYCNTAGNYWYGVTDPDSGKEGYVFAGEVRVKELLWDATITGVDYPEDLSLGSRFWIKGTVSTRYTGLQTVTGSILKNGTVRYTCSVNTTSAFSLLNSKIDDALCFNELEAGGYNYLVSAKCRNYYATDGTTLASPETKTITVHSNYFSVGGHVHAYTIEEHEAAHPHRCYKRCSCGDYQYTGKTAYVDTCEECKYSGTCGADGDNLTWKLNRDTGELTISGTGYMKDYDNATKTPWYGVRNEIKTVTVGSGATDVGAYAFSGCSSLTGVTLPDSLTAIRRHAFSESSLKKISIPENVTLIGEHAFWNTSMYNITVPKKVSSIGAGAFSKGLMQAIFVDEENQYYTSENGVLYNKDKTLLHTYLKFTSAGTKYGSKNVAYIPDTVTEIGDEAFYDFRGEEIHMGSSVQTIGRDAFARCDNLETILLPASVSYISTLAFCDSGLKTVYCEGSAPETFGHCIFPDKATLYCKEDIDGWRTLASDEWNSYLLKEMLGLGECGMDEDYDQLIWTLDPDGTLNISGSWQMKNYGTNGNRAPWYDLRDKIKSVTVGDGVKNVGANAFSSCSSIVKVTLPDSLEEIQEYAFVGCSSLGEIIIPENVTFIGYQAFAITRLRTVTIPKKVQRIELGAFGFCYNLVRIDTDAGNPYYVSEDGVLYNKTKTLLHTYPGGKNDQEGTAEGSKSYFRIPDTVTEIGDLAFYEVKLNEIYMGPSVKTIGFYTFGVCDNLKNITLSANLSSIGAGAFSDCYELTQIHIPASVTSIANDSFANCKSLSAVYFEGNAPSACSAAAFNNCASGFAIYYNPGTTGWTDSSAYDASAGTWNGYRLKSTQEPEPSEPGENIPENAVLISAEEIAVSAGREVRIMLKLSNNPGINSLRLKIAYDPGVFTLVSASDQGIFGRAPTSSKNITVNPYTMVWASDGNTTENGGLVELVFRVSETAEVGTKRIALTAEQVFNQAEEVVAVAAKDISVNVRRLAPGDANGDGEIDLRDATRLLQYFADWDVTVEKDAADVNGDGEIDLRDATRLLQYLAGWDVSLAQ